MARRLTTLTHGVRKSDGGGPLARVTREPPSGSVSRVGWSGFPFEDGDDLFELQTFGLRQVPGGERNRQHREAGESHHHPRQPAPLVQGWECLDDHEVGQPVDTRADRGGTAAYAGGEILALDQLARTADTDREGGDKEGEATKATTVFGTGVIKATPSAASRMDAVMPA